MKKYVVIYGKSEQRATLSFTRIACSSTKRSWVNESQRMKDSERKRMSESEVNERETFTHW
jgi:hypothetical protein